MMADDELPDDPETAQLIYERTKDGPARQAATSDANDSKASQVFAAATILLGFGAFTTANDRLAAALYGGAVAAYVLVAVSAWWVVRPRGSRVVDAADKWWPSHRAADVDYTRAQMLDKLASASDFNRRVLEAKAPALTFLFPVVLLEGLLVGAAAIARLV